MKIIKIVGKEACLARENANGQMTRLFASYTRRKNQTFSVKLLVNDSCSKVITTETYQMWFPDASSHIWSSDIQMIQNKWMIM